MIAARIFQLVHFSLLPIRRLTHNNQIYRLEGISIMGEKSVTPPLGPALHPVPAGRPPSSTNYALKRLQGKYFKRFRLSGAMGLRIDVLRIDEYCRHFRPVPVGQNKRGFPPRTPTDPTKTSTSTVS